MLNEPLLDVTIRIIRRYDVVNIESNSFGAVPYNFKPKPLRTPKPTIQSQDT